MSTRDKKLVELEMLLQRPRNKRKIVFGRNLAKIQFDNRKKDFLIISGSSAGISLSGSTVAVDGTLSINGTEVGVFGGDVTTPSTFTDSNNIAVTYKDFKQIREPTHGGVIKTNQASLSINNDNTFLYLGANNDFKLYYAVGSSGQDHGGTLYNTKGKLLLTSSAEPQHVCVSGSTMIMGPLGDNGTTWTPAITPIAGLNSITDCTTGGTAVNNALGLISNGQGGGEMIKLGTSHTSVSAIGHIVMLNNAIWHTADRSDSSGASAADAMLGVALAVDGASDEGLVLLRGIIRIDSALMNGFTGASTDIGRPVYLSTTAGEYDMAVSSTSNDIVRIVGHMLDTNGTDHLIYFNPSNDWVKVS